MGLMRALTLKRASGFPTRLNTLKGRPQISLPTELISTTNNISYTAPSVESMQEKAATAASTYSSEAESENASTTTSSAASQHTTTDSECPATPTTVSEDLSRRSSGLSDSAPSLTDASSVSSSPVTPPTQHAFALAQDRATSYFTTDSFSKPSSRISLVTVLDEEAIDPLTVIVPALPRRAPSHSKHEHERLARRRSQRVSMMLEAASPAVEEIATPVMPELAEVEEEIAVPAVTVVEVAESEETLESLMLEMIDEDEEIAYMREHKLKKFSVSGYLDVVGDVWGSDMFMADEVVVVV